MKYRWGFLDENDNFTECEPKVDNATAIDYARESNEMFYRAKLNGSLSFRFEFNDIIAQGYNVEHRVVLQSFDNDLNDWREIWRGRFALTDCEIDYDTNTITVTPQTLDRYTNILEHLEDEYNLTKLAAKQQPVNILIRPCLQVYALNDSKLSNWIGNNAWEATCDAVGKDDIGNYHFVLNKERIAFMVQYNEYWTYGKQTVIYIGEPSYDYDHVIDGVHRAFYVTGNYYDTQYGEWRTKTLLAGLNQFTDESVFRLLLGVGNPEEEITYTFARDEAGTACDVYIGGASVVDDSNAQWDKIYTRILLQTELAEWPLPGSTLYDIAPDDMAGINANYNKIATAQTAIIILSSETQQSPTEWGQAYTDLYFVKPSNPNHLTPIGQGLWKYISYWYYSGVSPSYFDNVTATRTIKDSYMLPSIILQLCFRAGNNPQYLISRVLGGNNDYVGEPFYLCVTPKSNVISSYYDTPAQNAPISLAKVFSMLKQAYKIYWHIDENDNIHLEHISYYENGFSYTETQPDVLVDLDTTIHTNTKSAKDHGQNKVKFDKSDMPQTFTFGWMDAQTKPFDGWPLKCLDNYVQKGTTEEKIIGDFSTDIDFILSSPNDVSKEGFALFACPSDGVNVSWTLNTQTYTITDENGEQYDISIQNADASFFKICRSYWRYALPCENVEVNNEPSNAITTGNFKSQSVEFADSAMAEVLKDVDNANKIIRTQQGDGHVKTISVNLNSLTTSGDLLFNFIGRWYYLRGAALGNSIIINFNGESITISVDDNRFTYRYKEPISVLKFNAADVVSVNFADVDKLDNLTSADEMFDGCEELLAVDFGNKTFGAVTSANNMFRGCVALTTLICPDSSTWKADLDFSDCPDLTLESFYDLIKFLYYYNAGVHTITPNTTFWNALDADTQNDIIAKATERGWTIGIPAQYSITGQSAANTVYVTINGTPVEISVVGGSWQYDYNAPITSISFENDADVTDIDFSLSDGLAGVTSLNDAFKNCAGLTTVDFTNCYLSNVTSASDAFAGCVALTDIIIPAGTWKPDIDLSDTAIVYADMPNVINGLFTYSTGTHTILFNSTIWDALSQPQQQTISDAAQLKGWTTNAVAVVYYIRGTSSNVNGTETFTIQFIDDGSLTPSASETITCNVDGNGDFEYTYQNKKIYAFTGITSYLNNTITELEFTEDFSECLSIANLVANKSNLTTIKMQNAVLSKVTAANQAFLSTGLTALSLPEATFENLTNGYRFCNNNQSMTVLSLPKAKFDNVTNAEGMFGNNQNVTTFELKEGQTFASATTVYQLFYALKYVTSIDLSSATFASATNASQMLISCAALTSVDLSSATFSSLTNASGMFSGCSNLTTLKLDIATFASLTNGYQMFYNCPNITTLNLNVATFEKVTEARFMFNVLTKLQTLSLPEATFEKATSVQGIFSQYNNAQMTTIYAPKATFESLAVTANANFFNGNYGNSIINWTSKAVGVDNKSIGVSFAFYAPKLNYASFLNVANWVKDLSGLTAQTITLNATAWNALSSAEQTTIDGILNGKNWTRAIA